MNMTENICILVVEDSPEQRDVLSRQLETFGISCICAASCEEGRSLASESKFPCALIDLGLPDGSGADLLPIFKDMAPHMVCIILTGYDTTQSVIATMRSGAFDYLTKPVELDVLKATISRALAHHDAIRERDELLETLFIEREQLKAKIEAATEDIRQYAHTCEVSNERLSALLHLTQVSSGILYTDEGLLRRVSEVIGKYIPLKCLLLCSDSEEEFLASYKHDDDKLEVVVSNDDKSESGGMDTLLAAADPELLVRSQMGRNTNFDISQLRAFIFPQVFWNRPVCTVGIFTLPEYEGNEVEREFLGMCAHFVASEWQQAHLLQHATQQASVGNVALELSRTFLQSLTAIGTATDFLETETISEDVSEGLSIVSNNVELLRRQILDFQKLSSQQSDSIETVQLSHHIDQALGMLSVTIHKHGVRVVKDFACDGECLIQNGVALARTFLNLISYSIREVDYGCDILLRLRDSEKDNLVFEISLGESTGSFRVAGSKVHAKLPDPMRSNPGFLLDQRTVHSCGGKLSFEKDDDGRSTFRILLPRNADKTGTVPSDTT